ncbi:radical SAM protein [Candidatus Dojkabacteria bacterium]|nr:radical SAM protein [Candidatus Dojkabacteria bacterium]
MAVPSESEQPNQVEGFDDVEILHPVVELILPVECREEPDLLLINLPSSVHPQDGRDHTDRSRSAGLEWMAELINEVSLEGVEEPFKAAVFDAYMGFGAQMISLDEIETAIEASKPKLVGINPTSVNLEAGLAVAEICDRKNIPYIVGGIHASIDPQGIAELFPSAFATVRGSGPSVIREIIYASQNEGSLMNLSGVSQPKYNNVRENYATKTLPMDEIPPSQPYKYGKYHGHVHEEYGREVSMVFSEGCPCACTFCASPVVSGKFAEGVKPYRRFSIERIMREIEQAYESGVRALHILDDNFLLTAKHAKEIASALIKFNSNKEDPVYWRALARADVIARIDDETMSQLKESGAWRIAIGIESGDEQILKKTNKNIDKKIVLKALRRLKDAEIETKGFFIMGFPDETREQILKTKKFILKLQKDGLLDEVALFQFKPYPGTEEYQKLEAQGISIPKVFTRDPRRNSTDLNKGATRQLAMDQKMDPDLGIAEITAGEVAEIIGETLGIFYPPE